MSGFPLRQVGRYLDMENPHKQEWSHFGWIDIVTLRDYWTALSIYHVARTVAGLVGVLYSVILILLI